MATIKDILSDPDKVDMLAKVTFAAVDTDQSGYIDRSELKAVMNSIGIELDFESATEEDVEEIIKELSSENDGSGYVIRQNKV